MNLRTVIRDCRWPLLLSLLCGLWLTGCVSIPEPRTSIRTTAPHPPFFLVGPAAMLFTNSGSYVARVEMEIALTNNVVKKREARLLVSGGRMFFQPQGHPENEMNFVWDTIHQTGFVLNDSLQGYAPVTVEKPSAEKPMAFSVLGKERKNGQDCEKVALTGDFSTITAWRAAAFRQLPVCLFMQSSNAVRTVNFSKIEFQPMADSLFAVPEGFTRYESIDAMQSELIRRSADMSRHSWRRHYRYNPDFDAGYSNDYWSDRPFRHH